MKRRVERKRKDGEEEERCLTCKLSEQKGEESVEDPGVPASARRTSGGGVAVNETVTLTLSRAATCIATAPSCARSCLTRVRPARNGFHFPFLGARLGEGICMPRARPRPSSRQPNIQRLHPMGQAGQYTGNQTRPKPLIRQASYERLLERLTSPTDNISHRPTVAEYGYGRR